MLVIDSHRPIHTSNASELNGQVIVLVADNEEETPTDLGDIDSGWGPLLALLAKSVCLMHDPCGRYHGVPLGTQLWVRWDGIQQEAGKGLRIQYIHDQEEPPLTRVKRRMLLRGQDCRLHA